MEIAKDPGDFNLSPNCDCIVGGRRLLPVNSDCQLFGPTTSSEEKIS